MMKPSSPTKAADLYQRALKLITEHGVEIDVPGIRAITVSTESFGTVSIYFSTKTGDLHIQVLRPDNGQGGILVYNIDGTPSSKDPTALSKAENALAQVEEALQNQAALDTGT